MAGKRKLDPECGGAIEGVGIVGKENIGHVTADERLDTGESLLALAAGSTFALVIDADKVELGAIEGELRVFLAKQLHAGLRVEISGFVFGASVDFVVAVAAPGTERGAEAANLFD